MDRMRQERRRFGGDEAAEIFEHASTIDARPWIDEPDLDLRDLHRIGEELGISEAAIDAAISQVRQTTRQNVKESRRAARRRLRFIRHVMVYVIVVGFLALLDAIDGGGWWFFTIAVVWGIILALHGMRFITRRNGPLQQRLLRT